METTQSGGRENCSIVSVTYISEHFKMYLAVETSLDIKFAMKEGATDRTSLEQCRSEGQTTAHNAFLRRRLIFSNLSLGVGECFVGGNYTLVSYYQNF